MLTGSRDTVEKFVVVCGDYQITVEPKLGEVWLDTLCVIKATRGDLVWKRRMQFQMATKDENTKGLATCLYYIVGVGSHTYRLFEDGHIEGDN